MKWTIGTAVVVFAAIVFGTVELVSVMGEHIDRANHEDHIALERARNEQNERMIKTCLSVCERSGVLHAEASEWNGMPKCECK